MDRTDSDLFLPALVSCLLLVFVGGCAHRVGIEWVVDYSSVGKAVVDNRDDCARGFYDVIKAHGKWWPLFDQGDGMAWEKHFKRAALGGQDYDWVDMVNFAYFAGHGAGDALVIGTGGGFTFGADANDDWVLASEPPAREPRWGDQRLDWIVLDVTSVENVSPATSVPAENDSSTLPKTLTVSPGV